MDIVTNLPHLIGFRFCAVSLQIDEARNSTLSEHMVATSGTLLKAEFQQQNTQIVEGYVGVRVAIQDQAEEFLILAQ